MNTYSTVKKAKDNDKIKGIYIEAGLFSPDSYASLQAIRRALSDFKKSGKWIVAYGDSYTQGVYYLASVADKLYINPQGQIDWHGIAAERMYMKDLMAKFGVKMQVTKVGTYKSATEQFTNDKMSDADREQTTAIINGVWKNVVNEVAASRKLTAAKLNSYADSLITFASTNDYVKMGLADGVLYNDQVKDAVKKMLKINADEEIKQLSIGDMANVKTDARGKKIAIAQTGIKEYHDKLGNVGQRQGDTGTKESPIVIAKHYERHLTDNENAIENDKRHGMAFGKGDVFHRSGDDFQIYRERRRLCHGHNGHEPDRTVPPGWIPPSPGSGFPALTVSPTFTSMLDMCI